MMENKNPAALAGAQPGSGNNTRSNHSKLPVKWKRVLAALLAGESLNRFEAERQYHDHCLHSTVSTIQSKGVSIYRSEETVPGFYDIPTRVCRYWIAPESRTRALELLRRRNPCSSVAEVASVEIRARAYAAASERG